MDVVSLKLDEHMLMQVDQNLQKHNFSTRTEFIRDAIREKLEDLRREELMNEFLSLQGKATTRVSNAQLKAIREEVFHKLLREKGWSLKSSSGRLTSKKS
jgi:metal-responsive CopG/Arc/MetJ family transcriptional regulator